MQCGRETFPSHEAESLPSHRGQAAYLLPEIHLVGCVFADSPLFFPLCFQITRVPQCNEKNIAWFSMNSVEVPKGKSKHLYLA